MGFFIPGGSTKDKFVLRVARLFLMSFATIACVSGASLEEQPFRNGGSSNEAKDDSCATMNELVLIRQELDLMRAEQAELRARLEGCGCVSTDGPEFSPDERSSGVVPIDLQDEAKLKEVFFGGSPWIVACQDRRNPTPLLPVFLEAARHVDFNSFASFARVFCWEKMRSGRTIAQRFNLPSDAVLFAVANGDTPAIIEDVSEISKPWQLKRKVQAKIRLIVAKIASPEAFVGNCTNKRACLILGFKSAVSLREALQVVNPLTEQHRNVRFVAVDTSVWKMSLDPKLVASRPKQAAGKANRTEILCLARTGKAGKGRAGAFLAAQVNEVGLTPNLVSNFANRCAAEQDLVPIVKVPTLIQRTPKPVYHSPGGSSSSGAAQSSARSKSSGGRTETSGSVPRYSSAKGQPRQKKRRGGSKRAGRVVDHVGSREKLDKDEEDEPLFTAVDGSEDEENERGEHAEEEDEDIEEMEL